tara:strand:+ start:16 stop:660 length:645 start_codon:yes stop_codon:yes gene_type:complete
MYKKFTFSFVISIFCVVQLFAQVGVGTTNPESDLHIVGSMAVQKQFELGTLGTVTNTDEDFKLLTRRTDSTALNGEITKLNVDELTVAPINVLKYYFHNLSYDNIVDLNLSFETSRYIVGLADIRYIGAPVNKRLIDGGDDSIGTFVARTFESNGTWHLEIRNRFLDTTNRRNAVHYECTFIIYDTSFYRKLPVIRTDLGGNRNGSASAIPDLY